MSFVTPAAPESPTVSEPVGVEEVSDCELSFGGLRRAAERPRSRRSAGCGSVGSDRSNNNPARRRVGELHCKLLASEAACDELSKLLNDAMRSSAAAVRDRDAAQTRYERAASELHVLRAEVADQSRLHDRETSRLQQLLAEAAEGRKEASSPPPDPPPEPPPARSDDTASVEELEREVAKLREARQAERDEADRTIRALRSEVAGLRSADALAVEVDALREANAELRAALRRSEEVDGERTVEILEKLREVGEGERARHALADAEQRAEAALVARTLADAAAAEARAQAMDAEDRALGMQAELERLQAALMGSEESRLAHRQQVAAVRRELREQQRLNRLLIGGPDGAP